jgi:uncharacterized membrane protein YbaN (DUF454 family)
MRSRPKELLVLGALKNRRQELAHEPPGHRFQNRYRKKKQEGSSRLRMLWLIAGFVLMAAGLVLLVIPGPGSVLLIIGAAFLAEESQVAARILDRLELKLRKLGELALNRWRRTGMVARSLVIASTLATTAMAAWLAYSYFLR